MRLAVVLLALPLFAGPCPPGYRGTVSQKTIGPSIGDRVPVGIAVRSIRCAPDGIALPDDASILPSKIYGQRKPRRIWPWQWFHKPKPLPRIWIIPLPSAEPEVPEPPPVSKDNKL